MVLIQDGGWRYVSYLCADRIIAQLFHALLCGAFGAQEYALSVTVERTAR